MGMGNRGLKGLEGSERGYSAFLQHPAGQRSSKLEARSWKLEARRKVESGNRGIGESRVERGWSVLIAAFCRAERIEDRG
jgi:hypothetical protein